MKNCQLYCYFVTRAIILVKRTLFLTNTICLGSQDDGNHVITPNVASQSEITAVYFEPTNKSAYRSPVVVSCENTSLVSGKVIDQSKRTTELGKD